MKSHDQLCADAADFLLSHGYTVDFEVPVKVYTGCGGYLQAPHYRIGYIDVLGIRENPDEWIVIECKTRIEKWSAGDVVRQLDGYANSPDIVRAAIRCLWTDTPISPAARTLLGVRDIILREELIEVLGC